jgi:hypothetical protein
MRKTEDLVKNERDVTKTELEKFPNKGEVDSVEERSIKVATKRGRIFVVCGEKNRLNELVGKIILLVAGLFTVEGFAKTSDLSKRTDKDVVLSVLSLIGGKADPPWDIFWLGRRFQAPVIVEVAKRTSATRRYRCLVVWKAYEVFDTDDDVCNVIRRISPFDKVLLPSEVYELKADQMQKLQKEYIALTKQPIEPPNVVIAKS